MERLKQMKECLMTCVQNQITGHLDEVDTKELGEAIDMIKDLEEAIYYKTITEAMEGKENKYQTYHHPQSYEKDMDIMYYDGMKDVYSPSHAMSPSHMPDRTRDVREGSSPSYRKMYMESKELNKDKTFKMQSLENYVQELSKDITDMIKDASPEERQLLHQKISILATKIK